MNINFEKSWRKNITKCLYEILVCKKVVDSKVDRLFRNSFEHIGILIIINNIMIK